MSEIWYRCKLKYYSTCSFVPNGCEQYGSTARIEYYLYNVLKHTPKGVWLVLNNCGWDRQKIFVLGTARKQWALPTKELALEDAIRRKEVHVYYANKRLLNAQNELAILKGSLLC